jgi:hypothetical protein
VAGLLSAALYPISKWLLRDLSVNPEDYA